MKTFRFIGMALFAVLMCVNFAACSNEENEVPQKGKEIMVSFGLGGEISVSESPLSRTEEKPDLYGIQIYSCPISSEGTTNYTPYAYGLFDDMTSVSALLIKGYKYKVGVLLIKNGKNVVKLENPGANEKYGSPFSTALTNTFTISTTLFIRPSTQIKFSDGAYYFNGEAEKYYGETIDFIPSDENNSIDIYMKKMFFGVNFVAENLTEGTLSIIFEQGISPQLDIVSPNTNIEKILAIGYANDAYASEDFVNNITITLIWTKTDGAEIPLGTHKIAFKRNKMHTVTIKVSETTSTSGLNLTFEDLGMTDGENTTIENGEIVDTGVDTGTEE